MLCPNCHAYTETYCCKNVNIHVEDEVLAKALQESPNIRQALIKVGMTPKGGNYTRARELIEKYKPDFVINSVHTLEGNDYCRGVPYRTESGEIRPKREVYEEYFDLVKRSAEVDYEYDILGHAGYCTRYAPYEDKGASYKEYAKEWDGVLKAVIARDKILEINTSNKLGVSPTLPDRDVLERYYELGGRKVSIGSDAHFKERILDKRDLTVKMLKEIGFTAVTVPDCGKHLQVEI